MFPCAGCRVVACIILFSTNEFFAKLIYMIKKAISYLCGATLMALAATPAISFARDYIAGGTVGVGAQVHQFVLRDPLTGAPMPGTRYRLFIRDHEIAGLPPVQNGVIFGITDSRGRTASVRLPKRYATAKWTLDPIIGEGDFGEAFRLSDDSNTAVVGLPYLLDMKGGFVFCGVQSQRPQTVALYTVTGDLGKGDFAWCKRAAEAVSRVPADDAAEVFRVMLAHYESGKKEFGTDMAARLRDKLVELAMASRDSQQFDIAVGLDETIDYNNAGYQLINANWMVERGLSFIDEALAQKPDDPNILDSKGWGLFRLGQSEQALSYFERSIAAFDETNEDNLPGRAEGLAHKGEVLWQLERQEEALLAFGAAKKFSDDDATLLETLARLQIDIDSLPKPPVRDVGPSFDK